MLCPDAATEALLQRAKTVRAEAERKRSNDILKQSLDILDQVGACVDGWKGVLWLEGVRSSRMIHFI